MRKIIIISLIITFLFLIGCKEEECSDYQVDECPEECEVCPPCKVCSSISCQTEEFCNDIGFDRDWYDSVRPGEE